MTMSEQEVEQILERLDKLDFKIDNISKTLNGNGHAGLCEQTRNNAQDIENLRQDTSTDIASFKVTMLKQWEDLSDILKRLTEVLKPQIEAKNLIDWVIMHWKTALVSVIIIGLVFVGFVNGYHWLVTKIPELAPGNLIKLIFSK
jgi:hypothetical protein